MAWLEEQVSQAFEKRFGEAPALIARAPGRVNLIGEHTDYNDGFVLPMALDRAIWIAARPRQDGRVLAYSEDFEGVADFSLADLRPQGKSWVEYLKGMAWALRENGYTPTGWEGVIVGDVPIGASLSSSAALEMAVSRVFAQLSGFEWKAATMAKIGQQTENKWVGVNSGIMDQMISAAGEEGYALLIDCRSLETQTVPVPPGTLVVIMDSMTRRELVESKYNERRAQCEAAAKFFNVKALRDVSVDEFRANAHLLEEVVRKRARHVITENARTLEAADVMRRGDAARMGQLMNDSHISMRDDFEISRPEVDALVACAQERAGCYGARMTGGGFGGCAVALVDADAVNVFVENVTECYAAATGITANIYVSPAGAGAQIVKS
jgi:galactokinase